ncbi:uncharacterized protein N7496_005733 [Penicillium cataractarum]|uniref:Uncharacterized protein n=1 Tax=Penicillium cataractarum TaxID=2100454 RepID=A0A9W9VEZ4_9EURO|nr:uncharacterized protein N7496_005733 [Penicillium cataractarum]KAJ5378324.1 hypothetical protein N7496_005733 [Penicillium cataractarum]
MKPHYRNYSTYLGYHEPLGGPDVQLYKRNVNSALQNVPLTSQIIGLESRVEARRKSIFGLHRHHLQVRDTLNKSDQAARPMSPSMPEQGIFNNPEKGCLLGPSPE